MATIEIREKKSARVVNTFQNAYYDYYKGYIVVFSMKNKKKLASFRDDQYVLKVRKVDSKEVTANVRCGKCGGRPLKLIGRISVADQWGRRRVRVRCKRCGKEMMMVLVIEEVV